MLTPEQLKERKKGIGGSDAGPILGISLWRTPLDIYRSKLGLEEPKKQEIWHWVGHQVEKGVLIPYYEMKYERTLSFPDTYRHKDYDWMLANVDALDGNIIVECKNCGNFKDDRFWGKEGTDEIPLQYMAQAAHYMEVLDLNTVVFVVLFGGNLIEEFILHRDKGRLEGFSKVMIEKEQYFWEEHVLKQIPPEPKTLDDITKLFPYAVERKTIEADDDTFNKVKRFIHLDIKSKQIKKKSDEIKLDLLYTMKDAEILEFGNEAILTHKNVSGKCKDHRRVHIPLNFKRRMEPCLEEDPN